MLIVLGTVRLPPENLFEARLAMQEMIEASREEDGCISYSYAEDVLEPGLVRVSEVWRDQEALDEHFASEHLEEWRANWGRFDIHDRNLTLFKASGAKPL